MSSNGNFEVEAEVRILDRKENSRCHMLNDEYKIVIRDAFVDTTLQFWIDYPDSSRVHLQIEQIELDDIPENIASVMQEYVDNSIVSWPTVFDSRQGNIDSEKADIGITNIEEGEEVHYHFMVRNGDYGTVLRNGEFIEKRQIPSSVLHETEQYLPMGINYKET